MRLKLNSSPSYIDLSDEIGRTSDKRSRAGKKAKTKGASFERRIAKSLGEWWGVKFYRTPQSGGSHLKEGYELAGDIATPADEFRLHIECKNQESWTIHGLMTSAKSAVWKWWDQTLNDCPVDRVPVLIFTRNHLPAFIMMQDSFAYTLLTNYWNDRISLGLDNETLNWFEDRAHISVNNTTTVTLDRFLSIPKSVLIETFKEECRFDD